MRKLTLALPALLFALPIGAQNAAPERITTLTLDEAVSLATRNNPAYLEAINSRRSTALGVRTAYGAFFPRISSNLGFSWREGLPVQFEGQTIGAASNVLGSSYGINIGVGYSLASFLQPKQANAQLDQADANVAASQSALRQNVTVQYFTAVQAVKNADLQDTLIKSQDLQLQFASARERVGSGTPLDTKTAEVNLGRQRLAAIRAHNSAEVEKVKLFELIGIPATADVQLTTDLPVTEPKFNLQDLLSDAKSHNSTLQLNRAQQRSAEIGKKQTSGNGYIPSFNMSTGIGGYTNMNTDATGASRTWPFSFTRQAMNVSAGFSLTIWDGFSREQNVEAAAIRLSNAQQEVRRTELNVSTTVSSLLSELTLDWRAIQLQLQIVESARQALLLAQNRYQIGSTAFTDLSLALDAFQREQNTLLNDTYTYHRTFAQLEAVVGRPLR